MLPLSFPPATLVPRRALAIAALPLALAAAPPAAGQPPGLGCGDRPPGEYAVVLDASSSLQQNTALARSTEASYVDVLERIAGMLCQGERMVVYPMVRDSGTRMLPVDAVLPAGGTREQLRGVVQRALRHDPGHSDLLLVVRRTWEDILERPDVRAAFFLTDGSYFPHPRPAPDRRLQKVIDRLTDLQPIVASLRQEGLPFYVVGIGAAGARAVDPELTFAWPDSAQRAWWYGAGALDLKAASGEAVLSALFGTAYVPLERLELWHLLVGGPAAPWQRRLEYRNGWARPLKDFRSVRMEHLVFRPADGGGPGACDLVRDGPRASGVRPVQAVRVGEHAYACSVERPTSTEIDSIAARGVTSYAFRQTPRFHPAEDPAPLYGLHEFVLSLDDTPCPEWKLSQDVLQNRLPRGPRVGLLELVPLSGRRAHDTVSMVHQKSSPCIVPSVTMDTTIGRQGEYLLFLSDSKGEWVHRRRFELPKLELARVDYRPGGFPFPPGRLVLLGICVNSAAVMRPGEKLVVELDTAIYELDPIRPGDCPDPGPYAERPYAYGFRGVVLLASTNIAAARVGIAAEGESGSIPQRGGWLSVRLTPNGTWFLSRNCLFGSALLGALIQIIYLWYFAEIRLRHLRKMRRLLSLALSVFMSAMLVVVFMEFLVMVTQSPLESSSIPVPFGLVVFGHALKLLAAALVPELVEDTLLPP